MTLQAVGGPAAETHQGSKGALLLRPRTSLPPSSGAVVQGGEESLALPLASHPGPLSQFRAKPGSPGPPPHSSPSPFISIWPFQSSRTESRPSQPDPEASVPSGQ